MPEQSPLVQAADRLDAAETKVEGTLKRPIPDVAGLLRKIALALPGGRPGVPEPTLPVPGVPEPTLPVPGVPQPGVPVPGVPAPAPAVLSVVGSPSVS